jgi:hypothetical protein
MVIEERERVRFLRSRNAASFGTWMQRCDGQT